MIEHKIIERNVSRETLEYISVLLETYEEKLSEYAHLLLWWNEKVNLLSRSVTLEEVEKHIVHSLFISVSALWPKQKFLVDIGTGGGLPGIPLAICYGTAEYILLDRVAKKNNRCS
jgi:16S rRNA (guanine527-N7)-methyltransferase